MVLEHKQRPSSAHDLGFYIYSGRYIEAVSLKASVHLIMTVPVLSD